MTRARIAVFGVLVFYLAALAAYGQLDKLVITAGTPEDKDLSAIGNEQDAQKRIAMYQDFLQKYASTPVAVAYGNWQLAVLPGGRGFGEGDRVRGQGRCRGPAQPRNSGMGRNPGSAGQRQCSSVQIFVAGWAGVCSIDKQPKPADVSDEDFANTIKSEKETNQEAYSFFETSAYNVIVAEPDAKTKVDDIDQFTAAFPTSKLQEQASSMAMLALSELKDKQRLNEYAEKALAANPNNLAALLSMANSYVDSRNRPRRSRMRNERWRRRRQTIPRLTRRTRFRQGGALHPWAGFFRQSRRRKHPSLSSSRRSLC